MGKIFYFTGTGNSLYTAKALAEKIGPCDIISMADATKENFTISDEWIGFVFPVYAFGTPLIVNHFIEKLHFQGSPYIFCVTTSGGEPGGTVNLVKKHLEKSGQTLDSGYSVVMPDNYIIGWEAKDAATIKSIIAKADLKITEVADAINQRKTHYFENGHPVKNFFLTTIIHKAYRIHPQNNDKKFVAEDACISCGLCERVCPVDNVKLIEGKPTWHHGCEQCLACIQHCPLEAIQYGKKTKNKKRYKNPQIRINELTTRKVNQG